MAQLVKKIAFIATLIICKYYKGTDLFVLSVLLKLKKETYQAVNVVTSQFIYYSVLITFLSSFHSTSASHQQSSYHLYIRETYFGNFHIVKH